jgi:hypothetical protein
MFVEIRANCGPWQDNWRKSTLHRQHMSIIFRLRRDRLPDIERIIRPVLWRSQFRIYVVLGLNERMR